MVVGAGRMGLPIIANLVTAGHAVEVVDVREERRAPVEAAGATWIGCAVVQRLTDRILLTVLPGAPELLHVMLGAADSASPSGLIHLADRCTWIDLTSSGPGPAEQLILAARRQGLRYMDAAMGGGPTDAERGRLTFYVGGDATDLSVVRPVLEALAEPDRIHHMGGNGAGYLTKLLINQLWFGQAAAVCEAMLLGTRSGIAADKLSKAFGNGPAASAFISRSLPALLSGDHLPSFGLARVVEELDSLSSAATAGGVPWLVSEAVTQVHRAALDYFGDIDGELLGAAWLEEQAGYTIAGHGTALPGSACPGD